LGASLLAADLEAGTGDALAEAAFMEKILFQSLELLIEKVAGYFNEAGD